ncbi:NAD(P)/FAD-dependent oxidoreductase [Streptomyces sp. NPDC057580]|uniref:NAD(P)/FAD-dependent oxidoreductase n=1 Tax=Streptomyces sp. NPDC057580 TaxID=3346173 RepID=UPI0036B2AE71
MASASPSSVIVVGAGVVGLATAWHLQRLGVQATVVERDRVAAGSSWGNAGWLSPAVAVPLPEPQALKYGVRSLVSAGSPVRIRPGLDARLARFLLSFARHCTQRQWQVGLSTLAVLNRQSLAAYDELAEGGVAEPTHESAPALLTFRNAQIRSGMVHELEAARAAGVDVDYELIDGDAARAVEPALSGAVGAGVRLLGQRNLNPGRFTQALADAVVARGGNVVEGAAVRRVTDIGNQVVVRTEGGGGELRADAVVLATGTWLNELARQHGVRVPVQAGRGYSFSVPAEGAPAVPTYLGEQKVVCTPMGDGVVRVGGVMELARPELPLDPRRVEGIVSAARPFLPRIDWEARSEEWVGSRPCTPDGLPLVGATRSPRVFLNGGHGMWGVALGPLTGRLLAQTVATGRAPAELAALHPLR